jgi:hypothetical protein
MHARALENVEVGNVETPVLHAAGDDDRARTGTFVVGQRQDKASPVAIPHGRDAVHLARDRRFDSELLRLGVSAGHQRHAADRSRKAQIVLDPGRGAGLAAEGTAVEHQDGEPFRRRIDRGGKTRRAGPDDRHVIDAILIDRSHQSDATGELGLAGIAQ